MLRNISTYPKSSNVSMPLVLNAGVMSFDLAFLTDDTKF